MSRKVNEECWILTGRKLFGLILFKKIKKSTGSSTKVRFDWKYVLKKEEERSSVVGFWHTHPKGPLLPSLQDKKTMSSWVGCFGKPLLCIIGGKNATQPYLVKQYPLKWRISEKETEPERAIQAELWLDLFKIHKFLNWYAVRK